ncbi:MAG: glutathione S-transferase family protein [Rhodospirillaceae bacterium]
MKLYGSIGSPFVRKVRVMAIEGGYADQVTFAEISTKPDEPNPDLVNPLKKMPALATDDGLVLFDSRVICEYLDVKLGGGAFIPTAGAARWQARRNHALADGLMDAAVLNRYETGVRPPNLLWPEWIAGQWVKIDGALADLESQVGDFGTRIDMVAIAAGCALGYLDYRFPDKDWRGACPGLAAWFAEFGARPSMQATPPPAA